MKKLMGRVNIMSPPSFTIESMLDFISTAIIPQLNLILIKPILVSGRTLILIISRIETNNSFESLIMDSGMSSEKIEMKPRSGWPKDLAIFGTLARHNN
ncbi:hypothetical protein V1477_021191 [Vespula maculifrons]|uniref:Uncharacterized protein n=1 Tax=Vespula maculifrons TaxID=7453 RepID=A0ABD2AGD9_VESMC